MSGGPQVFLGATTFCSRCRQISGRCEACGAELLVAPRAAGHRRARPPASRPRREACGAGLLGVPAGGGPPASRPRGELRSARRLEARPGPAGLVMTGYSTTSHVIPLHVFQTLKSHRWNCNVLRESRKLTPGNYVRLLFWLTLWPRRTDDETPLNNDAVRGLVLTVIRRPKAS